MADPTSNPDLKPLRDYCNRIPGHRPGTKMHISTMIRFATAGTKAPAGEVVKLRATRMGNRWLTTDAWFADFLAALTTETEPTPGDDPRSPAARTRAANTAERELVARGC